MWNWAVKSTDTHSTPALLIIKEEGVEIIPRNSFRHRASYVTDSEFEDDLAATSTTPQGLQKLITAISTTSLPANLKMNYITKTKVMYDDL